VRAGGHRTRGVRPRGPAEAPWEERGVARRPGRPPAPRRPPRRGALPAQPQRQRAALPRQVVPGFI